MGTGAGVILHYYLTRAKLDAQVTRIQLSAHTLSRVGVVSLPAQVSEQYEKIQAWLPDTDGLEARDFSEVPLGRAQEVSIFSYYLAQDFDACISTINEVIKENEDGSYTRSSAQKLFLVDRIDGLIGGMLKRLEFPELPNEDNETANNERYLFPIDIISTNSGDTAVRVRLGKKQRAYQYLSEDEQDRNVKYLSYLLMDAESQFRGKMLRALRDEMVDARDLCRGLRGWFAENLDSESSFIVSVAFSNLGERPAMVNSVAIMEITAADGSRVSLPLRSEDFQADSSNSDQATRIVEFYKKIANIFGVAMTFDDKVSFDRTIVSPNAVSHEDFRSIHRVNEFEPNKRILELFNAASSSAVLRFWLRDTRGRERTLLVKDVPFGSNEVVTNRRIRQLTR